MIAVGAAVGGFQEFQLLTATPVLVGPAPGCFGGQLSEAGGSPAGLWPWQQQASPLPPLHAGIPGPQQRSPAAPGTLGALLPPGAASHGCPQCNHCGSHLPLQRLRGMGSSSTLPPERADGRGFGDETMSTGTGSFQAPTGQRGGLTSQPARSRETSSGTSEREPGKRSRRGRGKRGAEAAARRGRREKSEGTQSDLQESLEDPLTATASLVSADDLEPEIKLVIVDSTGGLRDFTIDEEMTAAASGKVYVPADFSIDLTMPLKDLLSQPDMRLALASAVGGAAALGASGGVVGLTAGGALGAICGLAPAVFTFGLSVPLGAVLGGGVGVCFGTTVGSVIGFVGGGAAGGAYVKRSEICNAAEEACFVLRDILS